MKQLFVGIQVLLMGLLVSGCSGINSINSEYLSLTVTSMDAQNYYELYHTKDNTVETILVTEDTAQYPVGTIDMVSRKVYFASRVDNTDQLMSYDMKTKEVRQLTQNLRAINKILVIEDKIFCIASGKGRIKPAVLEYELDKCTYKFISDEWEAVEDMSYAEDVGKLFYVGYAWREQLAFIEEYNNYATDRENYPELKRVPYCLHSYEIRTSYNQMLSDEMTPITLFCVYRDGQKALIRKVQDENSTKSLYEWDGSEVLERKELMANQLLRIDSIVYSKNRNGFYGAGIIKDEEYTGENYLFFYDFDTGNWDILLRYRGGYINNFSLQG